jgi:hypothetical protein
MHHQPSIFIDDPDRPGNNLYEEVSAIAVYLWHQTILHRSPTVMCDRIDTLQLLAL